MDLTNIDRTFHQTLKNIYSFLQPMEFVLFDYILENKIVSRSMGKLIISYIPSSHCGIELDISRNGNYKRYTYS